MPAAIRIARENNKQNKSTVEIESKKGRISILFSYRTPIACTIIWPSGFVEHICTDAKYSIATSKHLNQWVTDNRCNPTRDEDYLRSQISYFLGECYFLGE